MVTDTDSLIPLDKSWLIRLCLLDLWHGKSHGDAWLAEHAGELNADLQALARAMKQWRNNQPIDVGESGTLYRFLQFAAWKRGEDRQFIKRGTLASRPMVKDPGIVDLSLTELLKLDNGTSQWASAAVLLGNDGQIPESVPYKLQDTYDALAEWNSAQAEGRDWQPRRDETIRRQVEAWRRWRQTGAVDPSRIEFVPQQAEDYCFARAFDVMTAAEGEACWPALRQHESDRIAAMEQVLEQVAEGEVIDSADHRVVQAVAMRFGDKAQFSYPEAVNKSWPQFWQFIQQ